MQVGAVVSEAGLGLAENDDCADYAATDAGLYAWVIDGSTNIAERNFLDAGQGDVAWYAGRLSARLEANATAGLPLRALHEAAVRDVAAEFRALRARLAAAPPLYAQPMAAITLLRVLDGRAELYHLGDCASFALTDAGVRRLSLHKPRDTAVESRSRIAVTQAEVGFAPRAVWQDRLPALQAERNIQLNRDPLRVSTPVTDATFGGVEVGLDLVGVRALVLMSDGYERFATDYDLGDAETMIRRSVIDGPDRILAEVRAVEAADPECRRFPRLKPSDDATCLVIASL